MKVERARHIGIVAVSAERAALCYRTICVEGRRSSCRTSRQIAYEMPEGRDRARIIGSRFAAASPRFDTDLARAALREATREFAA